jgi:hypothetical protein
MDVERKPPDSEIGESAAAGSDFGVTSRNQTYRGTRRRQATDGR